MTRYWTSPSHGLGLSRVTVVATPDEFDITTVHLVRRSLLAEAAGHGLLVVDMTRSRFCDSAGRGMLVKAHRRARATDGELRLLVPAEGSIARFFRLTGVHQIIPVFASLADALGLETLATAAPVPAPRAVGRP